MDHHHHRSTTKVPQKPYKPHHTSKSTLKSRLKGKAEQLDIGIRRIPHQRVMSKIERRNKAKQKRAVAHQDHATSIFCGRGAAPRIVAIVPLSNNISVEAVKQSLNASVEIEDSAPEGRSCYFVEHFKQKIMYVISKRDVISAMDACRVADYVIFVISATEVVDGLGKAIVRVVEGQGVSNVYTAVNGLDPSDPLKRRAQVVAYSKSFMAHFFPAQEKVFCLDKGQECLNLVRSLCTTTPVGIRWREDRSWMLVEDVRWPDFSSTEVFSATKPTAQVVLTGVVRGKSLKADRLVHVGDWGAFQIEKITSATDEDLQRAGPESMTLEREELILDLPTGDQDSMHDLAPEEVVMADSDHKTHPFVASQRTAVYVDDHLQFSSDEDENTKGTARRVPRGTSTYQAAWYADDASVTSSDLDDEGDVLMDAVTVPTNSITSVGPITEIEVEASEYPHSENFLDPSPEDEADELAAHRASKKSEAEVLQFPDELELHPKILARERLARYRGLKSLRTSRWATEEDVPYQPSDWARLLEVGNYRGVRSQVMREALVGGGVKAGTKVHIYLREVPLAFRYSKASQPLAVFSLLRHEQKRTAVHFTFTLNPECSEPMKSKQELTMQCGPRRFTVQPLFSVSSNTPNDLHKFERYVRPGQTVTASFIAPLTWGSVPVLFFRRGSPPSTFELVGHGTALPCSTSRIIVKRIVLTGAAYKIHRRLVTVRYMFFNKEDVDWFKALQLWTNHGRQGTIKESLGTHGYFKATFDGKLSMQDAIGVSLYKRVWPRPASVCRPDVDV